MDNTTNTLAEQSKLRRLVNSYGVPRLIITGFLLLMFILAPVAGVDFATQITNVINRFSWNAIMVLAMVPMIHSGCGLNFGLPLGIISGLLGATLSIEFGFTGGMSFLMAIVIATPFALVLGGASVDRASIGNVFLGVILFHTMFIVAPKTGAAITGDSMIGEYFRVFVSYAVITLALVMYESKKRKNKSLAGQQLAAEQAAEEEASK